MNDYIQTLKDANKLNISIDKSTLSDDIKAGISPFSESEETTHYSVIDKYGNAVSVTTTSKI